MTTLATARRRPRPDTLWFVHWIRAWAVGGVFFAHMWVSLWANNRSSSGFAHMEPMPEAADVAWNVLFPHMPILVALGHLAVGSFFLISGFLIPMTMEGTSTSRFVIVRIFRVYPVWLVSMAITYMIFDLQVRRAGEPIGLSERDWWTNAAVIQDMAGSELINPVMWTLMIEVKFYIVCALLSRTNILWRAKSLAMVVVLWTCYAFGAWGNLDFLQESNPALWTMSQALAKDAKHLALAFAGVALYNRFRNGWGLHETAGVLWVCLISMGVCTMTVDPTALYTLSKYVGYILALAVFTLAYARRHSYAARPGIAKIADVSYSLYAIHFVPGFVTAQYLTTVTGSPALATATSMLLMVLLAWIVHDLVEVPANKFGKKVRLWPARSATKRPRRVPEPVAVPVPKRPEPRKPEIVLGPREPELVAVRS